MKKFEEPKVNVEMLELEDVITTSDNECLTHCSAHECDFDMGGF